MNEERGGSSRDVKYQGATVLEPKRGFYYIPIVTLDFASLYPSIMIANNLCYTTYLNYDPVVMAEFCLNNPHGYRESPIGARFVKEDILEGLLPRILIDLLAARKQAKDDQKYARKVENWVLYYVQEGRQLALKISANSVYGFTGAVAGFLACLDISGSVTSIGREQLLMTKRTVENHFTRKNGYEFDAIVIYGDTDSVFVCFGDVSYERAQQLGKEASELVTKKLLKPNKLEFEKWLPYDVMIEKKMYAFLKVLAGDVLFNLEAKGLAQVRRDGAKIVGEMQRTVTEIIYQPRVHELQFLARLQEKGEPTATPPQLMPMQQRLKEAIEYVKQRVKALKLGKVDLNELIVSKSLSKDPEAYEGALQPHMELAKRLRKEDPDTAPRVGDRVYYVVTNGLGKKRERVVTPQEVIKYQLSVDTEHYLEQIKKHVGAILEPIIGQLEFEKQLAKIFSKLPARGTISDEELDRLQRNAMKETFAPSAIGAMGEYERDHIFKQAGKDLIKLRNLLRPRLERLYHVDPAQHVNRFDNMFDDLLRSSGFNVTIVKRKLRSQFNKIITKYAGEDTFNKIFEEPAYDEEGNSVGGSRTAFEAKINLQGTMCYVLGKRKYEEIYQAPELQIVKQVIPNKKTGILKYTQKQATCIKCQQKIVRRPDAKDELDDDCPRQVAKRIRVLDKMQMAVAQMCCDDDENCKELYIEVPSATRKQVEELRALMRRADAKKCREDEEITGNVNTDTEDLDNICEYCLKDQVQHILKELKEDFTECQQDIEDMLHKCRDECQKENFGKTVCGNNDCDIHYKRLTRRQTRANLRAKINSCINQLERLDIAGAG